MTSGRNLSGCQVFDPSVLPSDWACVPLGKRIELLYGRALREEDRQPGNVEVFGSNGRVGTHQVGWLSPPGIVVGRKGTVGAVHYANEPFWPIDTTYYVRLTSTDDDFRYIYYLLKYLPLSILNAATGVPGLSRRDAYALRGAFPPKTEQASIARILDAAERTTAAARETISRTQRLRRALMQELLPPWLGFKRLDMEGSLEGVESIELAQTVADVSNGSTPSRAEGRYWRNGTIPWLATGKVHDRVISTANEFVTERALRECSIRLLPRGTVLVAMIGQGRTRGMSAYLDMEACINQNFGAFVPRRRVFGKWLFYYFDFHYSRLREIGGGTNQGALSCHLLKRLRLPLPTFLRQQEVAQILDAVEDLERRQRDVLRLEERLRRALMSDLLNGRLRYAPQLAGTSSL
jgi:type I restriction enzyme S subunit